MWFKLSELVTSGLDITGSAFVRTGAHFYTDATTGVVYEDRCNMSLDATWAMAAEPAASGPGKLHVIDPPGS